MRRRAKLRHECERCGLIVELERAGWFRDDDFYELFSEWGEADAELRTLRRDCARLALRLSKALFQLSHAEAFAENLQFAHAMERKFQREQTKGARRVRMTPRLATGTGV